jgi:hypothetical protein
MPCRHDQPGRCSILLYPLPSLVLDERPRCPAPKLSPIELHNTFLAWTEVEMRLEQDLDSLNELAKTMVLQSEMNICKIAPPRKVLKIVAGSLSRPATTWLSY